MKIAVVGAGYVGLVSGACFAEMGNDVYCVDMDKKKIDGLKNGVMPIYEPGLEELIGRNYYQGRLKFTTSLANAVTHSEILFITVGTPTDSDGSADLRYVLQVAMRIGRLIDGPKVIVNKSTVPVGTAQKVKTVIAEKLKERGLKIDFDVVSNPEFLKEGTAVNDFMNPDRVIVGVSASSSRKLMEQLYEPFVHNGHCIYFMDIASSELTKYTANAFLATKISFINCIAEIAEKVGADILQVSKGIGTDSRIGLQHLYAGLGYGGSCFSKDVKELIQTAKMLKADHSIFDAVESVNDKQKKILINKILRKYGESLPGKTFAIWGLSYKPDTDDMRGAPSISLISDLVARGAKVKAYDPAAMKQARACFTDIANVFLVEHQYQALEGADALCLVTEWKAFREPDFAKMKELMKHPIIFDGRNQYDPEHTHKHGFEHYGVGRNPQCKAVSNLEAEMEQIIRCFDSPI